MKHVAPILLALALTACGDDTYNYTLPEEEAPQPPIVEKPVPTPPTPVPPTPTPTPPPPVEPPAKPPCKKDHRDCEDSDD